MTKRINKILWNGTEVPQAATRADGLDGLNLGELFIKNDPQEPGIYTRTTDGKVVLLGGGGSGTSELVDWNSIVNKPTKVSYFINDAGYATTSDIDTRIDALVNGAPQAYDTLKEIADVLANNINSIDDILTALGTKVSKDDFNTAIANVNTAIDSLNTELGLKLDAVTFNELFEKVTLSDGTQAIKAKLGLFSDGFISAKGSNVGGTSSEGGAVTLYQLNDVLADGTQVSGATDGAVFVYDGKQGKWKGVAQSEIVPNLTGYATESWVLSQGFLTQHQDLSDYAKLTDIPVIPTTDINKGVTAYGWGDHSKVGYLTAITSAMVTSALGYTPFDKDNFTKANIKSTLGISDWALASSKPSYTTKEVSEDTNLYFTNARAVAALKSITDGLSSSITSNTTKINNLTTKVDDHIAVFNSMFKLVELSDGTMSIQALHGLWSDGFISAKGANSSVSSSSGGGLITSLYRYADLGKTFADTNNDTFNAYTINKINTDLGNRISVLEGKATNVSFTQSLTSGTQIGTITIDGASKNIYAPTIPTSDINKGVTAYGWGNHASAGYLTQHQDLSGYQTKITSSNKLAASLVSGLAAVATSGKYGDLSGTPTSLPASDVSAWAKAASKPTYKFSEITEKPTTIGGYGITDAYTKSQVDSALSGYLPLSGGTITSASGDLFCINRTSGNPQIRFEANGGLLGYIGFTSGNAVVRLDSTYYNIIHSGNIGSQSVARAKILVTDSGSSMVYTTDSTFYIGDNIYTTKSTQILGNDVRLRYGASATIGLFLNSSGNIGIGTTSPSYKLEVNGTFGVHGTAYCTLPSASADAFYYSERTDLGKTIGFGIGTSNNRGVYDNKLGWIFKVDTSDAISIGGGYEVSFGGNVNCNAVVYGKVGVYSDGYVSAKGQNTSSDMRLKNVLNEVVLSVKAIANAPSVRFAWKNGGGVDVGSSAQYWQGLLPDAVKERDGMLEMQYANIALLSAISLAKNFETHEARIARLEKENKELRNEINSLRYGA